MLESHSYVQAIDSCKRRKESYQYHSIEAGGRRDMIAASQYTLIGPRLRAMIGRKGGLSDSVIADLGMHLP
jgi:hypothetical protein